MSKCHIVGNHMSWLNIFGGWPCLNVLPYLLTRLEHLTMAVLIDRLVMRKHFYLAIRICQYLKITESEGASRILAHWACYKVNRY